MSFEADLKAHLQADATLSGLVADRIYPEGTTPQGGVTSARVSYTHVFGEPLVCLDGYTSGVQRRVIQIDCWSLVRSVCDAVAQAVFERLNVSASSFTVTITGYPLLDDYEPDTKLYRRSIGASCLYTDRADA